jgi:hypothetical protein
LLTVLIRSFGATWSRGTLVREEAERMILARAILETATPRATLAPGLQEGVSGQYTWSVRIAQASPEATPLVPGRADIPLPKAVGPWQLYRVNILVTAASGRRTSLETYRIGRKTR